MADELANSTMNNGVDIDWQACSRSSWLNKHIVVFSDGGFRSKQELAAAAWVVTEVNAMVATVIAKGSIAINACTSSFEAEAIALEHAVEEVSRKCHFGPNTIHGIPHLYSLHNYRAGSFGTQGNSVA